MSERKPQLRVYGGYQGKENPSERERIMHLLDEEKEMAFFASPARSDVEKLRAVDELFGDADAFLQPLTELIGQIREDQQTQELLWTIVEDERATIQWFKGLYSRLSDDRAATESLS